MGLAAAARQRFEFADSRAAIGGVDRQIADERKALAVEAARGERQHQRARARKRNDLNAERVCRCDEPRAGVGHRGQAGF